MRINSTLLNTHQHTKPFKLKFFFNNKIKIYEKYGEIFIKKHNAKYFILLLLQKYLRHKMLKYFSVN